MSRLLKFRAWDKRGLQMIDVDGLAWDSRGIAIGKDDRDTDNWERSGDYELMQYTGLKDKNGVEIYEGDVVTYRGKTDMMHIGTVKSEVHWSDRKCGFYPMVEWFSQRDDGVEVLGNIYEHPELLQ